MKKKNSTLSDIDVILTVETIEKKTAKKKMSTVIKFQEVIFFISCYTVSNLPVTSKQINY